MVYTTKRQRRLSFITFALGLVVTAVISSGQVALGQPANAIEEAAHQRLLATVRAVTGENLRPPRERRYVGQNCAGTAVPNDLPLWHDVLAPYQDLPVLDCSPIKPGLKARALVILPDAERITRWLVSSCRAIGQAGTLLETCGRRLHSYVVGQNGWQFIVAGTITEPADEGYSRAEASHPGCKAVAKTDVLYSFRDGITVQLNGRERTSWRSSQAEACSRLPQPSDADLAAYIGMEPASVKNYGRMAGLPRAVYAACDKLYREGNGRQPTDTDWRRIVRDNLLAAWSSGEDALLTFVARAIFTPRGACTIKYHS